MLRLSPPLPADLHGIQQHRKLTVNSTVDVDHNLANSPNQVLVWSVYSKVTSNMPSTEQATVEPDKVLTHFACTKKDEGWPGTSSHQH